MCMCMHNEMCMYMHISPLSENKTEPNLNANVEMYATRDIISRRERNFCTITEVKTKTGKVLVCETHHVLSARRALPWPK